MYFGTVCKLTNLRQHPNADRLKIANALGYNVIVGLDASEEILGIVFPSDGCLSHEMLLVNELYRKHPATGQPMKGFFEPNGRVKSLSLRGMKSEAFWTPLDALSWAGDISKLKAGDTIDTFNGHLICEKYYTPATRAAMARQNRTGKKVVRLEDYAPDLARHFDTAKLRHVVDFLVGAEHAFVLTEKVHGCVSEDTLVETKEYGDMTIGKIVKEKLPVNIKAFDTIKEEVVYVPVDDYYFLEDDGDWYEITLEDGTKLEITGNNPVWLPELACYRKAEKLIVGDVLLTD